MYIYNSFYLKKVATTVYIYIYIYIYIYNIHIGFLLRPYSALHQNGAKFTISRLYIYI